MANRYPFLCIERKTMRVEKKDEKMKPNEKAAERKIAIYPWTINKEIRKCTSVERKEICLSGNSK